jgi:hypothetical protein
MKKTILWSFIVIVIVGIGFVIWHILSPYKKIEAINAVPASPVFIVETDKSFDMLDKMSKSKIWAVLRKHELFAKAGEGMDAVDTIIRGNEKLAKFVGNRSLVVSMHMISKSKYDFLYVIDLRRISKILPVKDILKSFLSSKFEVKSNEYNETSIYQIRKKGVDFEPINIVFVENLLVASFSVDLVKSAFDQTAKSPVANNEKFKVVREKLGNSGMFRLYINYSQVDNYLNSILITSDPNLRQLSKSLCFTGLSFDIDNDEIIKCDGYTNYNDSIPSSFRAMVRSGTGKTKLSDVLPVQTASSVSLGFDRFSLYFENIMTNLQEVPKSFNEYEASIKQAEKYLKINVRDNLMSWIGEEAAMVHLAPMGLGKANEFTVFLKARDIDDARKNLDFVANQIRKRTPVKFDKIEYNGYFINYLSMKGFFKLLLGKYFQKLEKPYYTIIDDYVVFSNHPQSLKVIIDGVVNEKLLTKQDEYKSFINNFSRKSNVLAIINTQQFLKSLQGMVNELTWAQFEKNKEYLLCFPYLGFQLEEEGSVFKTRLVVRFNEGQKQEEIGTENISLIDTLNMTDTNGVANQANVDAKVEAILKKVDQYVSDDPNAKTYKETYSNGQIKVEFEMKDGFRHGDYREYYENGNVKVKGSFYRDHRDGTWKIYDENGKLLAKLRINS